MNTLDLAPAGGALAMLGIAFAIVGRPNLRLGGLALVVLGTCLLGVPLAPSGHEGFTAGVFVIAAIAAVLLGIGLRKRPWALAFLALAFVPARIPIHLNGMHGKFLLPLYLLAGAAGVQLALDTLLGDERSGELGRLGPPLAALAVWMGLSLTWSQDVHAGAVELIAFWVPFGTIALGLARLRWNRRLVTWLAFELVAMALAFALVGIWQHQTKSVFWNPKVIYANAYAPFYRVNSVFWDPSIYGRFLVAAMLVALVFVVRGRATRATIGAALAIVLLWLGLFVSYSQTSFASLAVGTAIVAVVAWGRPALAGLAVVVAALAVLSGAFAMREVRHGLKSVNLNGATSGRANLVSGGLHIAKDNPVLGVGVGGFRRAYAERYHLKGKEPKKAASHDTPVTVVAETGVIGLALYAWLLAAAVGLGFARRGRRFDTRAALSLGVLFVAIFVHSLSYADFFEDPMMWGLLGLLALVGAELRRHDAPPAEALEPVPSPSEAAETVRA